MWELIRAGNVMMIPLGLCSLVGLTVFIERLFALRRRRIIVPEVAEAVATLPASDSSEIAYAIIARNPGPFATVVKAGLDHAEDDWEITRDVLQETGRQEAVKLVRNLNILEIVAAVAPLLGLLGTVTGMIRVFAAVSTLGLGDPEHLSGGISEAMVTTAAGLIIGIPTLVAFHWLQGRADAIIFDLERYASETLDFLRERKLRRAAAGGEG